jgi:hypothetical protein
MRLLIWCKATSLGGGTKLFNGLVSSISREPNIEFVRVVLACPREMRQDIHVEDRANIEMVHLPHDGKVRNISGGQPTDEEDGLIPGESVFDYEDGDGFFAFAAEACGAGRTTCAMVGNRDGFLYAKAPL